MCGFIGFTGETEHRKEVIRKMADRIIHRGPDSEGYFLAFMIDLERLSPLWEVPSLLWEGGTGVYEKVS